LFVHSNIPGATAEFGQSRGGLAGASGCRLENK